MHGFYKCQRKKVNIYLTAARNYFLSTRQIEKIVSKER